MAELDYEALWILCELASRSRVGRVYLYDADGNVFPHYYQSRYERVALEAITALEEGGYLVRRPTVAGGVKNFELILTDAGKELAERVCPNVAPWWRRRVVR